MMSMDESKFGKVEFQDNEGSHTEGIEKSRMGGSFYRSTNKASGTPLRNVVSGD
jgi:hypothetical protein